MAFMVAQQTRPEKRKEAPKQRARGRRWLLRGILLCACLLLIDYLAYPRLAQIGGDTFDTGRNGLWLRYTWYFGEWQEADLDRLAERMLSGEIRYAYCHVRHLEPDGSLAFRKPDSAQRLLAGLRRRAPDAKLLSWVFVANQRTSLAPPVDITDPSVRQQMVREAVWLVNECGFDGVQWDYEVCPSGDESLLALLDETREALPEDAILSACTPMWYPSPFPRSYSWEESYFGEVARHCDQVCVMCYDSGIYLPRAYVWLVRQQAARATRAVANVGDDCQVVLGLPTYEAGGASHHPRAESLRLGIKGVREGMADPRAEQACFAGVALFADYTTSADEWDEYEQLWVRSAR